MTCGPVPGSPVVMRQGPVVLAMLALACGGGDGVFPSPQVAPRLDRPFTLREGEAAVFSEPALVITFVGVPADSRCPINAYCVWAGDATVRLVLHVGPPWGEGPDLQVDLHTLLDPRETPWGPYYTLRLLGLAPAPVAGQPRTEPYRATLVLESH